MDSEQERIRNILAGDLGEFQSLIEDYQRLVCHIVFRMVQNEADREEICQDVFIKVYQNLSRFQFKSKFSTWIAKIAYNTSINYLKKRKLPLYEDLSDSSISEKTAGQNSQDKSQRSFIEEIPGDSKAADILLSNQEVQGYLHVEINHLPVQFRTILTLYHLDELSYREISEIMELPEGTVKSCLFRGRKLLKERLMEKYAIEELME